MAKKGKNLLFTQEDIPEVWKEHWKGMPEFVTEKLDPYQALTIYFSSKEDVQDFANRLGRTINPETKYLWYPAQEEKLCTPRKIYVDE
jgi:hypothetical protein